MIWNNRLIKSIVLILGVFVLVINLVIYFNDTQYVPGINGGSNWWNWQSIPDLKFWTYDDYNTEFASKHYFGFRYFFNKLSTFPGLRYCTDAITKYGNIITNFKVTDITILDVLIAIFRIITTPIVLLFTFLTDIMSNLYWFISFIIDGIENPTADVVTLHDNNIGTLLNVPLNSFILRV